jgi:hypothetical protein
MKNMKMGKTGLALSSIALVTFAACSGGSGAPAASTTPAQPVYDSFEKIGDAVGCLALNNSDPETTDIAGNKYCTLEHPTVEGMGVTVYQYADVVRRDKSLKAGLVYEQSFLVLNDNWAISGDPRDLRKIRATVGQGDLRTAEAEKPSTEGSGVGPGEAEEEQTFDGDAEVVPFGKSVTYQNERVQAGKIYCGDDDTQFDSCRFPSYTDQYEDTTKAPKGQEFYVVAFTWKNVGKAPLEASDFGTLVTKEGLEFAADETLSDSITDTARGNEDAGFDTSSDMNPGTKGRIILAYAVPKGTKVDKIHWGIDSVNTGPPAYAIKVK